MRPLALRPSNTAVGREGNRPGRPSIFNPGLGAGVSSVHCCVGLAVYSGLSAELTLTDGGKANRRKKRLYSRRLVRTLLCEAGETAAPCRPTAEGPFCSFSNWHALQWLQTLQKLLRPGGSEPRVYICIYINMYIYISFSFAK